MIKKIIWQVDLAVFLLLVVLFLLTWLLGETVTPFVLALLFAYILNPAVRFLERRKIPRGVGAAFFSVILFAMLAGLLFGVIYVLMQEIPQLVNNIPSYMNTFRTDYFPYISRTLGLGPELDFNALMGNLKSHISNLSPESFSSAFGHILGIVAGTLNFFLVVLTVFLIPIFMIYLLMSWGNMKESALELMPDGYREYIIAKLKEVEAVLKDFMKGQLLVALIMGVMYCIGFYFAGVDMPILVGMGGGILNLVPYLGSTLAGLTAIILVLLKYHDIIHPLIVVGIMAFVQAVEGYLITPKVIGHKLGLHPIVIILSLLVLGKLFGFAGILLAVPIAAVIKVFVAGFLKSYRESGFYTDKS
jgi:predicted PurR-regulated permease PerM